MRLPIIASVLIGLATVAAHAETLRIGTSADYPPWESTDASGNVVGFDRDVGDEICKRIAADCVWTNQAFDGLLPSLLVGKFDLVVSALSITAARAKQVDFSKAYSDSPYHVAAAKGGPIAAAKTRADLEKALTGKVIGVQSGSTHEAVAKAHFKDADVRSYERNEQIADDLAAGRIDAGLLETSVWSELMKAHADQIALAGPNLSSADYAEFGNGQGIALKKGREDLKARVDKAIAGMLSDGTLTRLSMKSFDYDLSFKGQ